MRASASPWTSDADAELPFGRVSVPSRTALHLEQGLPYPVWARIGRHVRLIHDASAWWVGDWLVYGQKEYGGRYRKAIEATGFDYQTLRNYAWVASRFHASRRRDTLSFGHHAEVAALAEDDQETWLRRAQVNGWSRNELRRQLRLARDGGAADGREPVAVAIPAAPEQHERWRAAAAAEGCELRDWIADVLDRAAESVLEPQRSAALAAA